MKVALLILACMTVLSFLFPTNRVIAKQTPFAIVVHYENCQTNCLTTLWVEQDYFNRVQIGKPLP